MRRRGVQASREGYFLEDLDVGQTAEMTRQVGEADVEAFAAVSGDSNPLHMDQAYAEATPFKGRIAHGMLPAAYISALLGTVLPGPGAIYVSQSLRFRRPVRIGDEVTTRIEVKEIDTRKGVATLSTTCLVGGKAAVDGEAVVSVPRRPAPSAEAGRS